MPACAEVPRLVCDHLRQPATGLRTCETARSDEPETRVPRYCHQTLTANLVRQTRHHLRGRHRLTTEASKTQPPLSNSGWARASNSETIFQQQLHVRVRRLRFRRSFKRACPNDHTIPHKPVNTTTKSKNHKQSEPRDHVTFIENLKNQTHPKSNRTQSGPTTTQLVSLVVPAQKR